LLQESLRRLFFGQLRPFARPAAGCGSAAGDKNINSASKTRNYRATTLINTAKEQISNIG
jgi:hypothetical protein